MTCLAAQRARRLEEAAWIAGAGERAGAADAAPAPDRRAAKRGLLAITRVGMQV